MKTRPIPLIALLLLPAVMPAPMQAFAAPPKAAAPKAVKPPAAKLAGTVADIDKKQYRTVKIGNQEWMKENLNVGRYRNGDPIRQAQTAAEWADAAAKGEGAWCYYENDPKNGQQFGRLYNWHAVNDPRGLAPEGWHIPDDMEWTILADLLGGYAVAGGKLKSSGVTVWSTPNVAADDSSGFRALPAGLRMLDGAFGFKAESAYFWSKSEFTQSQAWYRSLTHHLPSFVRSAEEKKAGFSVRCLKNAEMTKP